MFVSERPDYMADWDWERNNAQGIKPDELTIASRKRVSWKCHVCGGQWDTTLKDRRGCPYCNKFKALPGYNDLATTHPDLASQWSYENNSLTPQDVTKGSQKKVFWRCEKGHVWDAQVNSRVAGQGCPFCNNRRVLQGYNDLATTRPDIARDWDYSKNEGITPCNIIAGSKKKIWWKCHICGFEWETTVGNRNRGNGCPSCAHVRVHEGKNDLLSNYPVLSAEWDYDKNTIAPEQVAIYSRKRVAWICPKGHSYQAVVSDRVKGSRCPICSRERLVSFPEKALY